MRMDVRFKLDVASCVALVFGILLWATAFPVQGGKIYFYVDENGAYHFSDRPKDSRYNRAMVFEDGNGVEVMLLSNAEYNRIIQSACRLYGVDEALIRAMIRVESNYNQHAVSRAGAEGLMQLMPDTARLLRVNDSFDPRENIFAGVCYMKSLLLRYNGDVKLALAAYNAGPLRVDQYRGIPPYKETRDYVRLVLQYREYYRGKGTPQAAVSSPPKASDD